MKQALIIVDLQNDFLPGGSLAVPKGDEVIPIANELQKKFDFVIATRDWHPRKHGSFAANHPGWVVGDEIDLAGLRQVLWPVHCVQNTPGANFSTKFDNKNIKKVFQKGIDPLIDSYSAFFDNAHRRSTGLSEYLKENNIDTVFIMGLATDYCVKFSVLDACYLGFKVHVIKDGCRGIELKPGDIEKAFDDMKEAGAEIVESKDIN